MNETPECEQVRPFLGELATGAATGHERAQALRHVLGCASCRHELTELARVADELLLLAPSQEPPPGFETAVVERIMKLTPRPSRGARIRRRLARVVSSGRRFATKPRYRLPARPAVRLATVAATLVLAASGGAGVAYWQGAPARDLAARYQQTIGVAPGQLPQAAPITTANGSVVGHVFLYEGNPPWATVALTSAPQSGDYTMSLVAKDGKRYPEGVCTVTGRSGISSYPLPVRIADVVAIDLNRPGIQLTVHP